MQLHVAKKKHKIKNAAIPSLYVYILPIKKKILCHTISVTSNNVTANASLKYQLTRVVGASANKEIRISLKK